MRKLLLLSPALLALAACGTPAGGPTFAEPPITPTERYPLATRPRVDEIALAPRADDLSPAQREALAAMTARYYAEGAPALVIQSPEGLPPDHPALKTASAARAELERLGVRPAELRMTAYPDPGGRPLVRVGFETVEAVVPECGRNWTNLTATKDNRGHANFGCAVTANMAAQIANPRDILGGRPLDPADAGRRSVVLGKYRAGEKTGAELGDQARGVVSDAID